VNRTSTTTFVCMGTAGIGVVVVSYETPPDLLARCLASIQHSHLSPGISIVDVVLVDNASAAPPRVPTGVRLVRRRSNDGFAAAVNEGIAALDRSCSLVFLLNPDAVVEPEAIMRSAATLLGEANTTVAVAPKMLLDVAGPAVNSDPPTIDSIGIGVNGKAEGANRGLGQPDLGQYDTSDDVFGACFGAALIRREAFAASAVGPIDDRLFLYYEDVAWCWAAQLLGFRIITEPTAVVRHVMSAGVVRERPYAFKFEYTERNLVLCALMFFEPKRALVVAAKRILGLLRGSLLGRHYPAAGMRAIVGVARLLPHVFAVRRQITRRRVRSDAEIIRYRSDEPIFFNSVTYSVDDPSAADAFARRRLARQ
jgi:GT2 family glycosyltransferase